MDVVLEEAGAGIGVGVTEIGSQLRSVSLNIQYLVILTYLSATHCSSVAQVVSPQQTALGSSSRQDVPHVVEQQLQNLSHALPSYKI